MASRRGTQRVDGTSADRQRRLRRCALRALRPYERAEYEKDGAQDEIHQPYIFGQDVVQKPHGANQEHDQSDDADERPEQAEYGRP